MFRAVAAGCFIAGLLHAQDVSPDTPANVEKTIQGYWELLRQHPDNVALRSDLAVLLARQARFDEAIAEYKKALDFDPSNPAVHLNLGLAYYKSGRISQAAAEFWDAKQKAPDNLQVALLTADCELRMGHNETVVALLEPIEKQNPDDLAIAYLLGTALIRSRHIEEGQKRVDRILRNGDSAEARFLLGSQMFEAGDYPAAVKQFASAIALNGSLPELQSYYGRALLNTGDPDAASEAFRKELAENPNDFEANLYLAKILIERKQWKQAEPLLNRALLVRPDAPLAKRDLEAAQRREQLGADLAVNGPAPGEPAPDFSATRLDSKETLSLARLHERGPVVLVFGSYTCPNFRAAAASLNKLYVEYKREASFYLIYIREAHSTADWQSTRNEREGITLQPATNRSEQQEHATMCIRKLRLEFPALLDDLSGTAEHAYSAWPSKAYVIDGNGRILYSAGLSELEFKPDQLEAAIRKATGK